VAEWTTGTGILAAVGVTSPTAEDSAWSEACAAAVNAGIDVRMRGTPAAAPPIEPPPPLELDPAAYPELTYAATIAGAEAYKRREAVYGLTGYVDLEGAAIRVARDYLEGVAPIIARHATVGIA
jgi:hypothetical protein